MRRSALAGIAALIALIVVAGCGSSGGSSDVSYRARANAICHSVTVRRRRLPPARNLQQFKKVSTATIAINKDALRRLRALAPPDDLKGSHEVIVTRLTEAVALQQRALSTPGASQAMVRINNLAGAAYRAIEQAAQEAKLADCAKL